MAEFEAKVYRLTIEEHSNADALEIARVGDYRSIVQKGTFQTGDLAVYIPEQAVCPPWLISALGLEGRLAGKAKNRVKAIKLRGVLSQGLIFPLEFIKDVPDANFDSGVTTLYDVWVLNLDMDGEDFGPQRLRVEEGTDVTEFLRIEKYEPVIPASMSGEVANGSGYTLKYDIENIKKYPDVLQEGEPVVITEKLHGTWACFGWHPECDVTEGYVFASKGLSAQGLIFKLNEKNTASNLYVRTCNELTDGYGNLVDYVRQYINDIFSFNDNRLPFYILGEIFGKGVQDLDYGQTKAEFRIFDVYVGAPGTGRYLDQKEKSLLCSELHLDSVPGLYVGPYSKEVVAKLTDGQTFVAASDSQSGAHMREGIVITPLVERRSDEIGRVILKSVSEAYLLRKGGTEFN